MSKFLVAAFMLSLLNHGAGATNTVSAWEWDDQDLFRYCPPSRDRCSEDGPEIRFPLRLESSYTSSSSCGLPCTKLACYGKDTILLHPALGRFNVTAGRCNVTAIDYKRAVISFVPLVGSFPACPIKKFISTSKPDAVDLRCGSWYEYDLGDAAILVGCSREFTPSGTSPVKGVHADNVVGPISDYVVGPISCLSNFSYLVYNKLYMSQLPLDCKVDSNAGIPMILRDDVGSTFKQLAERIISFGETTVSWDRGDIITYNCTRCEIQGRRCAFSTQRKQTFCESSQPHPHGSRVKVIAATSSVAAFVVLSLMVASVLYLSLKSRYDEEVHLKVEMFLKTYGTSKPTRYTFSDVKKIARRFKEKVGQGGFGSVYKGELPNGVPVAVKMLENSIGEGEEFINEVATIGRIHHANIVCLLGFCSEGTRRALIYEFMPNESLEKYIFLHDSNISQELLIPHKMIDIALGIARGMEYLHQGCNQRILHFDIKPHNILLDYNFNPKISDFGLAKMCARDQSIVTLTAARGTMGYIAPELYSRNFGGISYKSDVYSFGMLLLEMVSGRRNSDPSIESQNEVYLPEWVYEKVITGQELVLTRENAQEEKEKVRQLAIVALWCIQWNPKNRPSMTKVVNMLTGRLQNLKMPPKPFVSSASDPMQ